MSDARKVIVTYNKELIDIRKIKPNRATNEVIDEILKKMKNKIVE